MGLRLTARVNVTSRVVRRLAQVQRELIGRGGLDRTLRITMAKEKPSRLQTAIMLAADGKGVPPELLSDEEVTRFFGCERSLLGLCRPVIVVIVAGIRGGKTMLAANAIVNSGMVADPTGKMYPQQTLRAVLVAPVQNAAHAAFQQIDGAIVRTSGLRAMLVDEPRLHPSPLFRMKRRDGRRLDIEVAAANAGGLNMRSGYLAGFVLDEVAFFREEGTGAAVNAEEIFKAAAPRLLPGAQGWLISSPYGPRGLMWDMYNRHFGKPGRTLVVRAPTLDLFPGADRDMIAAQREESPDLVAREFEAEWIDADTAFFLGATIDAAIRTDPVEIPPQGGCRYTAAMDQAMRQNAWTLVVARDKRGPTDAMAHVEVALAREWIGTQSQPLDSKVVLAEMKELVKPYGITRINCDQYAIDPLKSVALEVGLSLKEHQSTRELKLEMFRYVDTLLRAGKLDLPPVAAVERDLRATRQKASTNGVYVDLPHTSDGRHCDYASSVALAVWCFASRRGGGDGMMRAMRALIAQGGPGTLLD